MLPLIDDFLRCTRYTAEVVYFIIVVIEMHDDVQRRDIATLPSGPSM